MNSLRDENIALQLVNSDLQRAIAKAAALALAMDEERAYDEFRDMYYAAEERSAAIGGYGHAWDLAGEVFMQFLLGDYESGTRNFFRHL